MSHEFRSLLRKIGSGPHTSQNLTRTEAQAAMRLMLHQDATPAQIGAFLISHRIKRPTGEELAGMADTYDQLGPQLPEIAQTPNAQRPIVFCYAYDGRSRTAPLGPLVALTLASFGVPVIQHGGDRVPTKEGVPLIELWEALGVYWNPCTLENVHKILETHGIGFVHLPQHFPLAQALMPYRDQIGKRPPLSTLELMWSPYVGDQLLVCGYVHPPTEGMFRGAFELRNTRSFITVKGLEGSCDLPRDRTVIIGYQEGDEFHRLTLAPRDYGFAASEVPIASTADWAVSSLATLQGTSSELTEALIWNAGFYLWRSQETTNLPTDSPTNMTTELKSAFDRVRAALKDGRVYQKLIDLQQALPHH